MYGRYVISVERGMGVVMGDVQLINFVFVSVMINFLIIIVYERKY